MRLVSIAVLFVFAAAPFVTVAQADPFDRKQFGLAELRPGTFAAADIGRRTGCLAAALYFEARGESHAGRMAVARVILNRVRARAYPATICGVVWQNAHRRNRCQFSFTCDGKPDAPTDSALWKRIVIEAKAVLCAAACHSSTKGDPFAMLPPSMQLATHYHADYVSPSWCTKLVKAARMGRHIFYVSERVTRTMRAEG